MSQQNNLQSRSILKMVDSYASEDKYDPDGKTSAFCRPMLKEQKEKLVQILTDKKANESRHADQTSTDNNQKIAAGLVSPVFMGKNVQKSVAMVN